MVAESGTPGTCTGRGSNSTTRTGTYPRLCTHTAGLLDEGCDKATRSQIQGSELSGLTGTVVCNRLGAVAGQVVCVSAGQSHQQEGAHNRRSAQDCNKSSPTKTKTTFHGWKISETGLLRQASHWGKRGATKLTPNANSVLRCMTRHDAQILRPWSQMDWQQQPVKRDMLRWQMERPVIRRFWAAQAPLQTGREHNPAGTRNEGQAGNGPMSVQQQRQGLDT